MNNYGACIGFDCPSNFLDRLTKLTYENHQIEVIEGSGWQCHSVRCSLENEAQAGWAFNILSCFLNELSWHYRLTVEVKTFVHGTGQITSSAVRTYQKDDTIIIHDFKQTAFTAEQHLALGFFREAFSSNSPFYTFLSYFKLTEVPFPDGLEKKKWIVDALSHVKSPGAKASIKRLKDGGVEDIADWLYKEGRHALAHAKKGRNSIDVNNHKHWQDIVWANSILEEIAEMTLHFKLNLPQRGDDPRLTDLLSTR